LRLLNSLHLTLITLLVAEMAESSAAASGVNQGSQVFRNKGQIINNFNASSTSKSRPLPGYLAAKPEEKLLNLVCTQ
jgi:hypothetical protein